MKENKMRMKGLAMLVVTVLLGLACLGVSLLWGGSGSQAAIAAGETTTVTLATDKDTVPRGGTIDLTVTITTTKGGGWAAGALSLGPLDASGALDNTVNKYLSMVSGSLYCTDEAFAAKNYKFDANNALQNTDGQKPGYLTFNISADSSYVSGLVPTTQPIILKCKISVSEDLPADVTSLNLGFRAIKSNMMTTMIVDGKQEKDVGGTGLAVDTTTVTIKNAGNDATLKGVKIAAEGQALSALTVADSMTWKGSMSTGKADVSAEANDAGAKIKIGTTATPTATVANNTKSTQTIANGSATIYIVVTAEDGTTTKTYQIAVTNTYARLDANVTKLDSTNSPTAASTMTNVGFAANGGKLNENSNAEQVINVPSDATEIIFRARAKGGYGIADAAAIGKSGCSTSVNSLTGTSDANGNTFKISNYSEGSTFSITLTAKDGTTTYVYNFKIHILSTDTSISNFYVVGAGETHDTYNNVATQADGVSAFYFLMPSTSAYKGTLHITTTESAATVKVNNVNYSNTTEYNAGPQAITVRVTAPAGNYKDYPVTLAKDVPGGDFTKLEFSKDGNDWIEVFHSSDYNAANLTYTAKINISELAVGGNIYVRYEAETGVTVSATGLSAAGQAKTYMSPVVFGKNEFRLTASTEKSNTSYTFIVNLVEDKKTIEDITIKDNDGNVIDGSKFTFSKATEGYVFTLPYKVTGLTFDVTVDGEYPVVVTENEVLAPKGSRVHTLTKTLPEGETVFRIHARSNGDTNNVGGITGNGLGEDGTIYTIIVTRDSASTDNTLKSLKVSANGTVLQFRDSQDTQNATFDPASKQYFIFIDSSSSVTSVDIEALANDENAEVTGAGTNLSIAGLAGTSAVVSFPISVKAQNGSVETYTVFVAREAIKLDSNFDINSIRIVGGDGTDYFSNTTVPGFNSSTYAYSLNVPYAVENVSVFVNENFAASTSTTYVFNRSLDTPVNNQWQLLNVGVNHIEVYAVAQDNTNSDGAVKYVFTINRAQPSQNAYLKNIAIGGSTIKGFNKETMSYTMRFNNDVNVINLLVESEDPRAHIQIQRNGMVVGGTNNYSYVNTPIELAESGVTVTLSLVVTLDGSQKIYTLQLVRAADTPILTSLYIGAYKIYDANGNEIDRDNPDPEQLGQGDYYAEIDHNLYTLLIEAKTDDMSAEMRIDKFAGTGGSATGDLNVDEYFKISLSLNINIVIRPLVGQDAVYNLHIKRKPAPNSNTNAAITISEVEKFNEEYHNGYNLYGTYSVGHKIEVLSIDVQLERISEFYELGTYQIFYNGTLKSDNGVNDVNVQLEYGVNLIAIDILASDGVAKRTVGVVVVRDDVAMDRVRIAEIYQFQDDYKANVDKYFYDVANHVTKLTVEIDIDEDMYYYAVEGADKLSVGMNEVKIKIYSWNGNGRAVQREAIKEITLMVYRAEASSRLWLIFFWVLLGVAIVELVVIIILALILKKKSKDEDEDKNHNNGPNMPIVNVVQSPPEPQPQIQQPQMMPPVQIMPPPVQYIQPMPMPPIVQQMPIQQQPVQAQPVLQDPKRPVNVQVKITGMGDNDGTYGGHK